jgi:hypothetical protein
MTPPLVLPLLPSVTMYCGTVGLDT